MPASGLVEVRQIGPLSLFLVHLRACEATAAHFALARSDSCAYYFDLSLTSTPTFAIASSPPRSHRAFSSSRERGLGSFSLPSNLIAELTRRLSTYVTTFCSCSLDIPAVYYLLGRGTTSRSFPIVVLPRVHWQQHM